MRRSPVLNRNLLAVRLPLPSPPSASAPPDATCDAAREKISPLGGMPSLQTSSRGPPSPFPTPLLRAPPARLPLLYPPVPAHRGRSPTPWPPRQDTSRWPVLRSPPGRRTTPAARV